MCCFVITLFPQLYRANRAHEVILPQRQAGPLVAVDGDAVYRTNLDDGTVMRVAKRGPATPRPIAEGLAHPWEIAVDAQAVYVTVTRDGRVLRLPREGGAPIALAESQGEPMGMALGGLHGYWARRRPGTIARAPRRGGAVQVLASGLAGPDGLAVDAEAGHAYWTDWEDGAVRRFEMQRPGAAPTVVSRGQRHPNGIAVDRGVVYFTTALRDGSAFRVDRDDSVHLLSRDPAGLVRIVTDERRVWWTTEHRSTVMLLAK
jgi:DNA-binding beta-propeller fold protein YncE